MLGEVDAVLWCTHATQAWRQSEAAVWDTIPEAVREKSVLLVTRFDKLTTDRDRRRVLARLGKETKGLFGEMFPISLTEALAAGDDYDAFDKSGGGAFLQHLIPLIDTLNASVSTMEKTVYETAIDEAAAAAAVAAVPVEEIVAEAPETTEVPEVSTQQEAPVAPPELALVDADTIEFIPTSYDGQAPSVLVASAEPVLRVESSIPVAASGALDRIIPKRVKSKTSTQSVRPKRPAATGEVVSMDAAMMHNTFNTAPEAQPTQLRSIFDVEPDSDADRATSL
jgi:hypothetical protein